MNEGVATEPRHLALFVKSLGGGGVQQVMRTLGTALAQHGHRVDLVVCQTGGAGPSPPGVRVVVLSPAGGLRGRLHALRADREGWRTLLRPVLLAPSAPWPLRYLPDLCTYLRCERPQVLLAGWHYVNLVAVWAARLAGTETRVVVSERAALSHEASGRRWRQRLLPPLIGRTYAAADAIVAVSEGVADDLACTARIPRERITTIYNPVVSAELYAQAGVEVDHPWFAPGAPPVVLGAGRLLKQKDFPTLVRAFARVRARRRARLVILGEGAKRGELEALLSRLGLTADAWLPGFVDNPVRYMARSAVFVLSSTFEGLPGVLIQALACGCPVVSTDCPSGPAEILENGRYGRLVPVGDEVAMARAVLATLAEPARRDALRARGACFSVERALPRYLETLLCEAGDEQYARASPSPAPVDAGG
jgi:glycosyltransferase involved in cell wall biosynthesis